MTPPPPRDHRTQGFEPDSTEHMRSIARDEAEAACERWENQAQKDGALHGIWRAIDEGRAERKIMSTELAETRGAAKAQARNVTIVVALIGAASVAAQIFGLFYRVRGGG
jgi:hypothetical protein